MNKKKLTVIVASAVALVVALTVVLIVVLSNNKDKGIPNKTQLQSVGINSAFNVEISGKLETSTVENEQISMKWSDSNEQSLDNTISWLQGEGFNSYNGNSAIKISEEGGKILSYTAEKIKADTVAHVYPVVVYADGEEKFIAETYYITEDFSVMGMNFKGGELYLDIYKKENNQVQNGETSLLNEWPANSIEQTIGAVIPTYEGVASGYKFANNSIGSVKNVQIDVFGASESDVTAYNTLLLQNEYLLIDGFYEKTLSNGDLIQITAYASTSYNPETFQMVEVVTIMVMLEKNSGAYTSWSSLNLDVFSSASLPSYNGGTSFDLSDISEETIQTEKSAIEQAIALLSAYESMLNDEQRLELETLRSQLPYIDEIECYMITVYGTNATQAEAYESALTNVGFASGIKRTADYEFEVDVSEDEGKAIITITRMPIELIESSNGGGGGASTSSELPSNLKIEYNDGVYNVTAIKIEENYLAIKEAYGMFEYIYYEKNGTAWDIYEKEMYESEWQLSDYQETEIDWIENEIFGFILDGVEGSKTGTETLLEKTVDVYIDDFSSANYSYTYTYYKDVETGWVLKFVMTIPTGTTTYVVNSIDTTVTNFGDVELPNN